MKKSRAKKSKERPYHHGDLRRALVQAALAIVTEEQDCAFSLREVARRADVSHNAPYNHFADKNDLLIAIAEAGMERLRDSMLAATAGIEDPILEFLASGLAYVRTGVENPALYRLVFGQALTVVAGHRPAVVRVAGARAKEVLEQIIERCARAGAFAIAADDAHGRAIALLSAWSVVHGLTMLVIDGITDPRISIDKLFDEVAKTALLKGLKPR